MSVPRVRLSRAAATSVVAGHPWVYREDPPRHAVGAVVELADGRDRRLAWGLADEGPIAFRVLGRGPREPVDGLLRDRVQRADAVRARLVGDDTDAWRVVAGAGAGRAGGGVGAGAGDGLDGVVVDRYGDLAVLRLYAKAWEPHLDALISAIASLPWCRTVLRRYGVERVDGRGGSDVLHGPPPPEALVISEHGMKLLVRPLVGQKTGLFLDQREHRALVRRWSAGRVVANLFAYTGGFSVAAALGGAARVTTVDIAPDAIEDAKENFRLNGLEPDAHGFEVADAFSWSPRGSLGLLVLDPPALARDRKAFEAARAAYRKLHRHHGAHVARDGLLATSSCTSRLEAHEWRAAAEEGLLPLGDWSWLWASAEPPDHPTAIGHPEGHYLKFAVLRRRTTAGPQGG